MPSPERGGLSRRDFVKTTAAGGAAAALAPAAEPRRSSETLVEQLDRSLTPRQRRIVVFPFEHPLRSKIDNNWRITPPRIDELFRPSQQALIGDIFRGLHNPEFYGRVLAHVQEDAGGLGAYSVALFGKPGSGKFEFVLTGRHCTIRCDGDSVEGAAFGGPMFYGHAAGSFYEKPDHPGNVYWYQAQRANEVFQALDGRQRELALLGDPRAERASATVALKGKGEPLTGLPLAETSPDQRRLVEKVIEDLLHPYRKADREEASRLIRAAGGVESLHMSFYENADLGKDRVWDVWAIESSSMLWYFRGYPHVHCWVNIRHPRVAA